MQRFQQICIYLLLLVASVVGEGCTSHTPPAAYHIQRFDSELAEALADTSAYPQFAERYADWLPIYIGGVLALPVPSDGNYLPLLQQCFADTLTMQLMHEVQQQYPTLHTLSEALAPPFARYEQAVSGATLPYIYTHVSQLHQSMVVTDTLLSISLDHYLGNDHPLYQAHYYPYQCVAKGFENIAPDAIRAWMYAKHPQHLGDETLLARMLYEGTVLYALAELFPSWSIYELLAYTPKQEAWCRENEAAVWHRVVSERHLYATRPLLVAQYTAPAPFTSPISAESPPRLGIWLGWRIVSSYLDNTRGVSWATLLTEPLVAQELLRESKYR